MEEINVKVAQEHFLGTVSWVASYHSLNCSLIDHPLFITEASCHMVSIVGHSGRTKLPISRIEVISHQSGHYYSGKYFSTYFPIRNQTTKSVERIELPRTSKVTNKPRAICKKWIAHNCRLLLGFGNTCYVMLILFVYNLYNTNIFTFKY